MDGEVGGRYSGKTETDAGRWPVLLLGLASPEEPWLPSSSSVLWELHGDSSLSFVGGVGGVEVHTGVGGDDAGKTVADVGGCPRLR